MTPAPLDPVLSVIVPAHNAMPTIRRTLEAIVAGDLERQRFELLLVDDGSTDETSLVAAEFCDVVVRLSGRSNGPAFARNRGVEAARGEILVFVDSDVVVHRDAMRRLAERFTAEPKTIAIFGSYDDRPESPGLVSQYRNLLSYFVHQEGRGDSESFWGALGAVRRDAFVNVGMFDEWHYAQPQIEDAELGRRLRRADHRIVCDPDIQGTHLKKWTFRNTIFSDFAHRGVPWMWLLLKEGAKIRHTRMDVEFVEKILTALAALGLLLPLVALIIRDWWPLLATVAIALAILVARARFYLFLIRARGPVFAVAASPLHLAYYAANAASIASGWMSHILFGEPIPPAEVSAHAQIGIATWPPPPKRSGQSIWELPPGKP